MSIPPPQRSGLGEPHRRSTQDIVRHGGRHAHAESAVSPATSPAVFAATGASAAYAACYDGTKQAARDEHGRPPPSGPRRLAPDWIPEDRRGETHVAET